MCLFSGRGCPTSITEQDTRGSLVRAVEIAGNLPLAFGAIADVFFTQAVQALQVIGAKGGTRTPTVLPARS